LLSFDEVDFVKEDAHVTVGGWVPVVLAPVVGLLVLLGMVLVLEVPVALIRGLIRERGSPWRRK
jgi:hypothetical protein